jgi:hypothetical protein
MTGVNDMNQPKTTKEVQKSVRKDRLARALKANIKRRKAASATTGAETDEREN